VSDHLLGSFFHLYCNDIYFPNNIINIKMVQIGTDFGEIWRIGSEMLGSRHGQIDVCMLLGTLKLGCSKHLGSELKSSELRRTYRTDIVLVCAQTSVPSRTYRNQELYSNCSFIFYIIHYLLRAAEATRTGLNLTF
jgi:hypothetical protein